MNSIRSREGNSPQSPTENLTASQAADVLLWLASGYNHETRLRGKSDKISMGQVAVRAFWEKVDSSGSQQLLSPKELEAGLQFLGHTSANLERAEGPDARQRQMSDY